MQARQAQVNHEVVGESDPRGARGPRLQLSERVLAIALGLSLWIAAGSLVLAVLDGLGANPLRRVLVGLALIIAIAIPLWRRDVACAALRRRPWLVAPIAALTMAVVLLDGVTEGAKMAPFLVISLTPIGLAGVVARPGLVWSCVAILETGYVTAIIVDGSAASALDDGAKAASVLGALLGYPFAALVILGLASLFMRFVDTAHQIPSAVASGTRTLTPNLTRALALGTRTPVALLDAPGPFASLTAREVSVVSALAKGSRPKEIAWSWGVSLATIRKHIRNAKRKTGASTLPELTAMSTRSEWSAAVSDSDVSRPGFDGGLQSRIRSW